jgi:hypothetical protein
MICISYYQTHIYCLLLILYKKKIANYNDDDLRRIEKERLEINAAYDNVRLIYN